MITYKVVKEKHNQGYSAIVYDSKSGDRPIAVTGIFLSAHDAHKAGQAYAQMFEGKREGTHQN